MPMRGLITCSLLAGLSVTACGNEPTYELRWTLGCASGLGPCEVSSARDCSSVGVGQIEIEAHQGTKTSRTVSLCFVRSEGPVGHGPGLAPGPVELTVWPLSALGRRFSVAPAQTTGEIPNEGVVQLTTDLAVPPACADGVDNDGDRYIDQFDPGCDDETDTDESG